MEDKLVKNNPDYDYYFFITNFGLDKAYYNFCHSQDRIKRIKSFKRRIACFVKTQPQWIQDCFKLSVKTGCFFLPGHNVYKVAHEDWLNL